MQRRRRTGQSGFTLIEMIVVVAVLALAATLVLARGPMRSETVDLRAAARGLAVEMRVARAQAIGEDRVLVFLLDPAHRNYGIEKGRRHELPRGIVVVADNPDAVETIRFRPDGSSSGGVWVLGEGDRRIAIETDWLTGAVSIRE
ncbi:prepilin-type N-terminal cleavage/methylation domain-containing protein [Acetobacteraceae bacterium KSS8]|uniref:Type II secretion system protein H n=1 Tax=Endosaccharibacter trunci TaxID=2812733 RepID=A0ABT1W8Y6_9PROT|nr:prepilin-type N-terminal cleavage/methylation domain-containing protein [Acetobacteraceae bacterium KSS8]